MTADCATTSLDGPITIPSNITTVDGSSNHYTISATDTVAAQWNGGILTVPPGQTTNIENLTVAGPAGGL